MTAMTKHPALPLVMVAPNGARRTKADHPALPTSIAETVETAKACFQAGAGGLHAHVRDKNGAHVLDAGLYRELLAEMALAVPGMQVQVTTESIGIYSPEEQRQLVQDVKPTAVSVAVREMIPDEVTEAVRRFYAQIRADRIAVQHILYSAEDVFLFFDLVRTGVIPGLDHQVIFVLGRYATDRESHPEELEPFLQAFSDRRDALEIDWAACAFGRRETECLTFAVAQGGKARIGFENGLWNRDGKRATDNADRVRDLMASLNEVCPERLTQALWSDDLHLAT